MTNSRKIITISATRQNEFGKIHSGRRKSKKCLYAFLFFLIIVTAFLILKANFLPKSLIVGLNEIEIRYDTFSISFENSVSEKVREKIKNELELLEYKGKKRFTFVEENGDIVIGFVKDQDKVLLEEYLIPVGHFYWIENSINLDDIKEREIVVQKGYGDFTESVLSKYLEIDVDVQEREDVLNYLLENEGRVISFVDFENLSYEYQVLEFDNKYFFDDLDGSVAFKIGVELKSAPKFLAEVIQINTEEIFSEFSLDEILKINMSGVTAISRNLAAKVERSGDNAYPARKIAEFLSNADLVHTSNEVSFVPNCIPESSMRFCSHPKYIETLEMINANIIELTGNHNNDFGAKYNVETIEMYKERGWDYYGGGLNKEDAQKTLFKELKDSKIAFIGYNYYDTIYNNIMSLAGATRAGANSFSFEKMEKDIKKAKEENAVVIVTFQFQECWSYPANDVIYPPCYKALSNPDQKKVFRAAVDYGADIVVGSQAHQPQTYEIYNDKLIFYGTGNLFFDQIFWIGTRQGMVLTHYVYKNKLIQSKISTTIYDNDMQPYITEGENRELLLKLLRDARD